MALSRSLLFLFFTPEEEDYFVDQYRINGFRHTLYFYSNQNRLSGWELANAHGNHTLPQPVLAIYPKQDPVADWEKAAKIVRSSEYLPNLTTKFVFGAHWPHLENPSKCNKIIREWLRSLPWSACNMSTLNYLTTIWVFFTIFRVFYIQSSNRRNIC